MDKNIYSDPNIVSRLNNSQICRSSHIRFQETEYVHMGKMRSIGRELVKRRLASQKDNWYEVEQYTARSFMTYLAILIGKKTDYTPATDRYEGFNNMFMDNMDHSAIPAKTKTRNDLRGKILENILPVPKCIDSYDLLKFKERNHEELIKFRNHIENFLIELDSIDNCDQEERLSRFIEESAISIKQITEKMNRNSIGYVLCSLCSISTSLLPIATSLASGSNGDFVVAIPGLLGAIYTTLKSNTGNMTHNEPLAYAAVASKKMHIDLERPLF